VACHFINLPNLTECQATTFFDEDPVGNTIPKELGLLTQLTYLWLSNNQLTGTIPSTLGSLTQLTHLVLSKNSLTGTIPSTLGSLTLLNGLYLYGNQLNGTIPSALGSLTQLTSVWLDNNQLTGAIPSALGSLTQLRYLDLWDNQLTGTIPTILGNLVNLSRLDLFNNTQLTGTIPFSLCHHYKISIVIDCANVECLCCRGRHSNGYDAGTCPNARDQCQVKQAERTNERTNGPINESYSYESIVRRNNVGGVL
jgi:Leucine rich repeat